MFIFYARSIWPFCTSWQALFPRFRVSWRTRPPLAIAVSRPRVFLLLPFGLTHSRDTYHWSSGLLTYSFVQCSLLGFEVLRSTRCLRHSRVLLVRTCPATCALVRPSPPLPQRSISLFPSQILLRFAILFQGYTAVPGQYLFRAGLAFILIISR